MHQPEDLQVFQARHDFLEALNAFFTWHPDACGKQNEILI